ncbi:MAG: translation initiation factor IF-3 [Bacteroidetes bacterium]|nr:MAG: translation initiation factor IF-3 [Bacteroidota bacterium]
MAKRRPRRPFNRRREVRPHRINREIRAPEVRLVGLEDGQDGIYKTADAIRMAEERELDLVQVAPKANPPVCRIIEYSKFRYEQKKREKANKAKQHTVVMKEIRFGPNTDDHDFNFKLKHAQKFLSEGNKLKAYVQFRGRNIIYKDRGRDMLSRFANELDDIAKIEMPPKMEGRRMIMIMAPKKASGKS